MKQLSIFICLLLTGTIVSVLEKSAMTTNTASEFARRRINQESLFKDFLAFFFKCLTKKLSLGCELDIA